MIEWGKVPWSLWLYVALSVGQIAVLVLTASINVAPLVFFIVFVFTWDFFLLRAVRWLWVGTVALGALTIAIDIATGTGTWNGYLVGVIDLGLLLLPATRKFFAASATAPAVT